MKYKYKIILIKMPTKEKELSPSEINRISRDISRILSDCPKYNIIEILEYAKELRENEGDIEDVDYEVETSEDESEEYETDTETEEDSE